MFLDKTQFNQAVEIKLNKHPINYKKEKLFK